MSSAQINLALEEGRLSDAAETYSGFVDSCPSSKRSHYLRLDVALAASRDERELGARLLEELLASPPLLDIASLLNHVATLVEHLLVLGTTPDAVRTRVIDGWLGAHPSHAAIRAHTEGLLLLATGDHDGAADALGRSSPTPDPCLAKPVIGALRTALAEALLGTGDRAGALVAVRRVLDDDLARWPGVRKDRAEALARRLQGASTRVDGELTAREREVAALLADGLTNGQLAERLFISPKTAAVHVSNILAKLGLSTRAEIAAWAVRHSVALSA